jgi:hypothetical protein
MSFALWLRFKMFCSDDSQFGGLVKSFVTALSATYTNFILAPRYIYAWN